MGSSKLSLVVALLLVSSSLHAGSNAALLLVPSEAVSVGMVRLSDMRSSPILGRLIHETDKITVDGEADKFLRETGLKPSADIDAMTFALLPSGTRGGEAKALVIFEGRFNAEKLTDSIVRRGARKVIFSKATYLQMIEANDSEAGAIAFLSNNVAIAGQEDAVRRALALRAAGGRDFAQRSQLGRQLVHVDPSANAWAVIDVTRAQRLSGGPKWDGPQSDPLASVVSKLKSVETVVLWTRESSDELVLGGRATSRDEETSRSIEDLVRGALAAWRMAVSEKAPELVPVIRNFRVDREDRSVTFLGTVPGKLVRDGMKKVQARR